MPATIVFDTSIDPTTPVKHTLTWATDVMVTRDGHEQRRSLRRLPSQVLEFEAVTLDASEMARLDSLLHAGAPDGFKVPMWHDRYILPAQLNAGAASLSIVTAGYNLVSGEQAILYQNSRSWELVTLSGVTGSTVTFPATVNTWPQGTLFMPVKVGYLISPTSPSRTFRDGQSTTLTFVLR